MRKLEVGLARTGDEVVVLVDGVTHLLPVREMRNSGVLESVGGVPEWLSQLWQTQKGAMKSLGFTMHKVEVGWVVRWRVRAATFVEELPAPPLGLGNTSAETDYHAWLRMVDASMPPPTPEHYA